MDLVNLCLYYVHVIWCFALWGFVLIFQPTSTLVDYLLEDWKLFSTGSRTVEDLSQASTFVIMIRISHENVMWFHATLPHNTLLILAPFVQMNFMWKTRMNIIWKHKLATEPIKHKINISYEIYIKSWHIIVRVFNANFAWNLKFRLHHISVTMT